ncbi:MAG: NADH-quinone oxidoreductase subunit A [bacterium]|nr:NADH-quinone oxidoreductase subunit A [bacterium]
MRPRKPGGEREVTYECGELPERLLLVRSTSASTWWRCSSSSSDVEVIFLYLWAGRVPPLSEAAGSLVFDEMAMFLGIPWPPRPGPRLDVKGDLDWVKSLARRNGPEVEG